MFILPPKTDFGDAMSEIGQLSQSIGEMVGRHKEKKLRTTLAESLSNELGQPELASLIHLTPKEKLPEVYSKLQELVLERKEGEALGIFPPRQSHTPPAASTSENAYQEASQIPETTRAPAQSKPFDWSRVPLTQLQNAAGSKTRYAESAKQELARRNSLQKSSDKAYEKADKTRESLPIKEAALNRMKDAIDSGDIKRFGGDFLAEVTGIEGFRSSSGAQLKNAVKEFFLNSIQRVGARPNQFIEQQIAQMMPQVGRNKEANQIVWEALRFETDIEKKRLEIFDSLSKQYNNEIGYVPRDLSSEVDEALKPYVDQRQDELEGKIREIKEGTKNPYKNYQLGPVPPGTALNEGVARDIFLKAGRDPAKATQMAIELGYEVQ